MSDEAVPDETEDDAVEVSDDAVSEALSGLSC